MTRRKHRTFST